MKTTFERVDKKSKKSKKTKFTHIQSKNSGWLDNISMAVCDFDKIVYLGNDLEDGDMFACYDSCGQIIIAKGIKGNEFYEF